MKWGEGGGGKRVTCVRTVFHHAHGHNADLEFIAGLSGDEVDGTCGVEKRAGGSSR